VSAAPRFYCPQPLAAGPLVLPAQTTRHIQVRRLQPGDPLTLFDGAGGTWHGQLTHMTRTQATVALTTPVVSECASRYRVHLAIGMPANERMDWVMEKATELGAASLTPLLTARSVSKPSGERAERRQLHWHGVVAAACAQSGRNHLPIVHPIVDLPTWLHHLPAPQDDPMPRFVLHTGQERGLPVDHAPQPLLLLCGPEGGLTTDELQGAQAQGFQPASLGPLTLRSDTAAIAAVARCTLL
jgi:16S rRNA (uracil1498-N3)-methyltransferase